MAEILAPRMIMSDDPRTLKSPLMIVPAWMVRIAPFATWTNPEIRYAVSAYSVRLAVMSVLIVAAALPNAGVVVVASPEATERSDPRFTKTRYRYSVFALRPLSVYVTAPPVPGAATFVAAANVPAAPSARSRS